MPVAQDRQSDAGIAVVFPAVLSITRSDQPSHDIKGRTVRLALKGGTIACESEVPADSKCVVRLGSIFTPDIKHDYEARVVRLSSDARCVDVEFVNLPISVAAELSKVLELSRKINRAVFTIGFMVFLKDTNAEGNAYFSRYFDWQGMAREAFFKQLLGAAIGMFTSGSLRLITVDASVRFRSELRLYDEVDIRVQPTNVRHTSVDLVFSYTKKEGGEEVATGRQIIAFANSSGSLISIPRQVLESGRVYLDDLDHLRLLAYLEKQSAQSAATTPPPVGPMSLSR